MKKLIVIITLFISFNAIGQKSKTQCLGITKAGNQCKRMVDSASYCYQHVGKHDSAARDSVMKMHVPKFKAGIVRLGIDSRGLISVEYVDNAGDKHALHYITKKQLEELIQSLK